MRLASPFTGLTSWDQFYGRPNRVGRHRRGRRPAFVKRRWAYAESTAQSCVESLGTCPATNRKDFRQGRPASRRAQTWLLIVNVRNRKDSDKTLPKPHIVTDVEEIDNETGVGPCGICAN